MFDNVTGGTATPGILQHFFYHPAITHVLHSGESRHQSKEGKAAGRINPIELHNFQIKPITSVTYL